MTLEPGTGGTLETDTTLLMGSFGGRGILLSATDNAGFQLATRTDAMLTRTTSGAVAGLASTEAEGAPAAAGPGRHPRSHVAGRPARDPDRGVGRPA